MKSRTPPAVEPFAATTYGLPYPLSTDPVSQGAAAIQALAEQVEKQSMRSFVGWRFASQSVPPILTQKNTVALDTVERNDFVFPAGNTVVQLPDTGVYLVTIDALFGGATGSGNVRVGVDRQTAAGVTNMPDHISQEGGMNAPVSGAAVLIVQANERLSWWVGAGSTGTGHTLTRLAVGIARIA